ncbi:hypothetical protein SDC9_20416 [bioreactor metagenome]|uniref:Uncharacterized protein n=1 Tax=bioreactor metagenome TaxID=1076179 RepID=A0A644U6P5_9ZZZZ|nr:zinc ribbon domain-containing protein [Methanocorpusculum sp.]
MDGSKRVSKTAKADSSITLRLSTVLLDKINNSWKNMGFANRTDLVESACEWFFDTLECPRCHNRNHKDGLYCSVCGEELQPHFRIINELRNGTQEIINKANDLNDRYSRLLDNYLKLKNVVKTQFPDMIKNSNNTIKLIDYSIDLIKNIIMFTTISDGLVTENRKIDFMLSKVNIIINREFETIHGRQPNRDDFETALKTIQKCEIFIESYYNDFKTLSFIYRGIKEICDTEFKSL